MIEVPEAFADSTLAREGEAGRGWIEALPGRVEALCRDWSLTVDGAPLHGYVAVVVPVRRGGEPLVLKVSWIDESTEQEALALRAWDGDGAVRLLDHEEDAGALLLERLDPHRSLADVPLDEAVGVAARLLARTAVPAPPGLRPLSARLDELRRTMPGEWERVGRPCPRSWVDQATSASEEADADASQLVNTDLHYENVLAGRREPWLVIDPKPLAGSPEYAVAPLLWNRAEEGAATEVVIERFRRIVEEAGLDAEAARRLTVVRLVDFLLWSVAEGFPDDAALSRRLLDALA